MDESVSLDLNGVSLAKNATRWMITNPDPESYNEPGKAPNIAIEKMAVKLKNSSVVVPPYSVSLYRLEIR